MTNKKLIAEQPQPVPAAPPEDDEAQTDAVPGDEEPGAEPDSGAEPDAAATAAGQPALPPSQQVPAAPPAPAVEPQQPPIGGTQADPAEVPQEPVRPFQNNGRDKLNVDGTVKPSPTRYRQPGPGDQQAIERFLKKNPRATDDDLHSFLRSLGIDPQEGEKVVMKLAREKAESLIPAMAKDVMRLFLIEGDVHESACDKRQANKPWRTPEGPKKFAVCGKEGDQTKLVRFGDPNMEIKRDNPERRANFRARHGCDDPGPKTKAKYWACKTWEKKKTVSDVVESAVGLFLQERKDLIPGGKGDKIDEKDVDQHELAMGIKVELEHTKDKALAKEIALDHLAEDPKYYTKLKKVHHESTMIGARVLNDEAPEPDGVADEDDETSSGLLPWFRRPQTNFVIRQEETQFDNKGKVTCGVFLPLPPDISRQFPRMLGGKPKEDDSPPHVTLLYVGPITPAEYTGMVSVVQRVIANYQPFFMDMHGADVFDDKPDYDTLYAAVTSRTFREYNNCVFPTINVLHADLRKALEDAGIKVQHNYGLRNGSNSYAERYVPHATIARVPKGEQCLVRPPSGSWFVLDVECWGWERVQLQLGKLVIDQPAHR